MSRNRTPIRGGRRLGRRSRGQQTEQPAAPAPPSGDLQQMLDRIRSESGDSPDIIIRRLNIGKQGNKEVAIIYLDGLVDNQQVNENVAGALLKLASNPVNPEQGGSWVDMIIHQVVQTGGAFAEDKWQEIILSILSGNTAILVEGSTQAVICITQGGAWRSVSEPTSQLVVRGPKDCFIESISTNISLIRRRIKSSKLHLETLRIGELSHTQIGLMYMEGVADKDLIAEVKERLHSIKTNGVLESAYIEEFIEDKVFTPFPTIFNTERPDVAASNLMEGRVVLLVEGTPFVLILPTVLAQFFQSAEDYSQRFDISILMRFVRYLSFLVLLLGPSIYIALTTFHYQMLPTQLLISLVAQREGVPFPAFVEAVLMEVAFEILREAGVRMPRAVGQTVSIVGALILGQAVVEAGIITPVMVIVVALTGIASFAIPAYNLAIAGRLIRFSFMVLAAMFGLYGITLGMIVLVAHMASLRSFGVPYLAPLTPFMLRDNKDTLLRFPMPFMNKRTQVISGDERDLNNKEIKKSDSSDPSPKKGS
ncbi:spore germination protein [Paenibacillus sp. CAA11]|uniref:spore germination protein n=1 Tax=Paenibacillus sp. CAA11 TaxID=1532905 RepID=UPI000D36CB65|nr:spore germination protein [Paenibacillus sp. CAA11]AWB46330.1 spore germination protein [Paenibacillus sp. CAA11]